MGVQISAEQRDLKKQHCRRPDGWAAPEPRQNELADQRLHLKQQKGAGENRDGISRDGHCTTLGRRRSFQWGGRRTSRRWGGRGSNLVHGSVLRRAMNRQEG